MSLAMFLHAFSVFEQLMAYIAGVVPTYSDVVDNFVFLHQRQEREFFPTYITAM